MRRYEIVTDAGPFCGLYARSEREAVVYAIALMGETPWYVRSAA